MLCGDGAPVVLFDRPFEADLTGRLVPGRTNKLAAETTEYPLTLTAAERKVSWTDTFAGGTVIYTNTRKTANVTITKTLLPATVLDRSFPFTVSITNGLDATHYEGYVLPLTARNITSGTADSWLIEGVPVDAPLSISENVDSALYDSKYRVGSGAETAGTTAAFTLEGNTTVAFTNTLKTQKLRIGDDDAYNVRTDPDAAVILLPDALAVITETNGVFTPEFTVPTLSIALHGNTEMLYETDVDLAFRDGKLAWAAPCGYDRFGLMIIDKTGLVYYGVYENGVIAGHEGPGFNPLDALAKDPIRIRWEK